MASVLVVPGLHGSGPDHWQTWLESRTEGSVRVVQRDWSSPDVAEWAQRIGRVVARVPGEIVIAAHSFGCLAAVKASKTIRHRIAGALLVAPASPHKFGPRAMHLDEHLPFPSMLVASRNDPWMSFGEAEGWADAWGSDVIDLGAAGHINPASGFGPWPRALELLERLKERPQRTRPEPLGGDFIDSLGDFS